ncbi:MAG: c-type cytochrome [Pyrinomonadaceae bacterium]
MNLMRKMAVAATLLLFSAGLVFIVSSSSAFERSVSAQASPTPVPAAFDQKAAIAKLKEQIKGREQEPASKVFKNLSTAMLKDMPAARLLAVMEFGYARSLGVNCMHCHITDKWEAEDKPQKQIARDMVAMVAKLNGETLKGIKNLTSAAPTVNCTTCHRGEIKPAVNLPTNP